jgi:hypothetical protein
MNLITTDDIKRVSDLFDAQLQEFGGVEIHFIPNWLMENDGRVIDRPGPGRKRYIHAHPYVIVDIASKMGWYDTALEILRRSIHQKIDHSFAKLAKTDRDLLSEDHPLLHGQWNY